MEEGFSNCLRAKFPGGLLRGFLPFDVYRIFRIDKSDIFPD